MRENPHKPLNFPYKGISAGEAFHLSNLSDFIQDIYFNKNGNMTLLHYKNAIKDLVEDGIKKQLDSLQDLIDKFNETKRTQQDLYEYEKEVAEQQDKISSIKKRLEAYKNDTSEEGMMNRQELEVELGKAETDLEVSNISSYINGICRLLLLEHLFRLCDYYTNICSDCQMVNCENIKNCTKKEDL